MTRAHMLSDEMMLAAVSEQAHESEQNSEGSVTLDNPIVLKDGTEYRTITLSEPTLYHKLMAVQRIGKTPTLASIRDSHIELVARVAGWPEQAVRRLGASLLDEAVVFTTQFEEDVRRGDDEEVDRSASKVITCDPPIEANGRTWMQMDLREPHVDERRRFDVTASKGTAEAILRAEIDLIEQVSGWPKVAVMKMPVSAGTLASEYLTGFFISGPQTGNRFRRT